MVRLRAAKPWHGSSITLDVAVDNSSSEIGQDALRVKAAGITNAMLAGSISNAKLAGSISNEKLSNDSVTVTAGSALTGGGAVALGSSVTLDVAVDNSSIEIDSDALRVKAAGITNAMLAGSIANNKLSNSSLTVTAGDATAALSHLVATSRLLLDVTVVRTSGVQSIAGAKTFSSAAVISSTTASTSYSTGCLTLAGGLGVAGKVYVNDAMYATGFIATSDATLKIAPISGALSASRVLSVSISSHAFLGSLSSLLGVSCLRMAMT